MSTQPVPTFPAVAGLEKFYGLTLEETINHIQETHNKESFEYIKKMFALDENLSTDIPDSTFIEILDMKNVESEGARAFGMEMAKIAYNKDIDADTRTSAAVFLFMYL
jgi:trans-2-enoyl-CoA reductase